MESKGLNTEKIKVLSQMSFKKRKKRKGEEMGRKLHKYWEI